MKIMTVLGEKEVEELGVILPHEHLLIDLLNQFSRPVTTFGERLAEQPVRLDNLGYLRRDPYLVRDNLILDDTDIALREVSSFREAGGGAIIDVTPEGIGRNPQALRDIALGSGVDIIAGCGFYTHDAHPPRLAAMSIDEIAEEIRTDLLVGIGETGIRAGVIGEIGTSREIEPNEIKVLKAAGRVQVETGVPLYVHIYPWSTNGLAALDILDEEGVDPGRVIICHSDVTIQESYMVDVLKRGAFLEFDNFGKEFIIPSEKRNFAGGHFDSDRTRVDTIRSLVDQGFAGQILITNDVCLKIMLHSYGGWGYDHILSNIVPLLQEAGISQTDRETIIEENPRKIFRKNI